MKRAIAAVLLVITACGPVVTGDLQQPDLPAIDGVGLAALLSDLGKPAVINVWASWCHPCRSEAPLLAAAHSQFGDSIEFIGIDVQDNQNDAKAFIAQFGLEFDHYFDRDRSVPNQYGAIGTPVTMFFNADGEWVSTHLGVIDDRSLALGIDEIANG